MGMSMNTKNMFSKKRLVIIDLHCDPTMPAGANEAGGGNVYMRQLLRKLNITKMSIIYITRKKYPQLEDHFVTANGVEFYRLDLGSWGANDKSILQEHYEDALIQIRRILNSLGQEPLIFHSSYWQSGKIAMVLAEEYQTFFVHTVLSNSLGKALRGGKQDDPPERILWEREIFTRAKYVLCSSESEAEDIRTLYGVKDSHILITGLAIDESYFSPDYALDASMSLDPFLGKSVTISDDFIQPAIDSKSNIDWWTAKGFLYVGRLHTDKGLDKIFEAWSMLYQTLGKNTPPLWIAGGSISEIQEFRSQIESKLPQLRQWESQMLVVWWGPLRPSSINALLLKAHAVVTHSRYESAGLVILEALTRGIPVLSTPYGYGRDLVRDWYNGFQITYGDITALYYRFLAFSGQPYLAHLMGLNAQETAKKAEMIFQFTEKHLWAYGMIEELPPSRFPITEAKFQLRDLVSRPLETFPYLVAPASSERVAMVFRQHLGTELCRLVKIDPDDTMRFHASTSSGQAYLVVHLRAHISEDHVWNRFLPKPPVVTISEQALAIKRFGLIGGGYKVVWESSGEGLVIMTMPHWETVSYNTFWTLAPSDTPRTEDMESYWDAVNLLIRETPELHIFLEELSQAAPIVRRAIEADKNLPTILHLPLPDKIPETAAALPFEQSRVVSLANFRICVGTYAVASTASFSLPNASCLRLAEMGWVRLRHLETSCKRILLGDGSL